MNCPATLYRSACLTDDLDAMLARSRAAGVQSMIITGGSLHESKEALIVAKEHGFYATVGCHPTRSAEFDEFAGGAEAYLAELDKLIEDHLEGKGRVVAVGECGLGAIHSLSSVSRHFMLRISDYDRLHFATEEVQRRNFRTHPILHSQVFLCQ